MSLCVFLQYECMLEHCHFITVTSSSLHCNALVIFTLTCIFLSHISHFITVQAQSGHRGLPTAPTITAALQSNAVQTSEEEASTGYEDWAVNRHSWMRNDLFGDSRRALNTGGHILADYSSYLGDSPLFEANALSSSTLPRYSTLDTVSERVSV